MRNRVEKINVPDTTKTRVEIELSDENYSNSTDKIIKTLPNRGLPKASSPANQLSVNLETPANTIKVNNEQDADDELAWEDNPHFNPNSESKNYRPKK